MDDKQVSVLSIKDENDSAFDAVAPRLIGETVDDSSFDYSSAIKVDTVADEVFSFVLYCNKRHMIQDIVIKNTSDKDIRGLKLEIRTDTELIDPYHEEIVFLPANTPIEFRRPNLVVHGAYIATLTEMMNCIMYISIYKDNKEIYQETHEITILPYDIWPGLSFESSLLAAFVIPNHPVIEVIKHDAASYLNKFTGSSAFDGYQSDDPNRVINMAAALYYALQKKDIIYSEPPSSSFGQKIRLPDEIINTRLGTCMDLTLFFAACLEQCGLRPILIMIKNHIFLGVWLVKDAEASEYLENDPSQIDKRIAEGVNEILIIECTAMCSGQNMTFDVARAVAEKTLIDKHEEFELFVDVDRARRSGVKPLPIRRFEDGKYIVDVPDLDNLSEAAAPTLVSEAVVIDKDYKGEKITKIEQWERKLLDFSMRNLLINVRPRSSMIPLLINDIYCFEDSISEENEYEIVPRPSEWDAHGINAFDFESLSKFGPYSQILEDNIKRNKISSWWPEKEFNKLITKLYRSAKESMEENGANTLYLALGVLKFFETKSKAKPRYAPLILIPISFIRKASNKGLVIRKRDDDAEVNFTLLEYLRQVHQIDVSGLNPPPKDAKGIDVKKIFAVFRRFIMDRNGWDVIDTSFVANFSFSQFVMWNDVHSHSEQLAENKIVRSLIKGKVDWDTTVPEDINNDDTFLPVPVDASQLQAIKMAANGISFVLHGPPGTGKSQTITAMISNALSKGKKVLFVAEKRAALDVVQKRLSLLGIEDFCLELHSNKAVKRNILDQLKRSVEVQSRNMDTNYETRIDKIHHMRSELDPYVRFLHEKHKCGMSVRELIDAYEALPDSERSYRVRSRDVSEQTSEDFERIRVLIAKLTTYGSALDTIENNPLSFVKQTDYVHSMRKRLEDIIYDFPKAIDVLEDEGKKYALVLGDDLPERNEDWQQFIAFANALTSNADVTGLESNPYYKKHELLFKYQIASQTYDSSKESFFQKFNESILSVNLQNISKKYTDAQKKIFGKTKAVDAVKAELQTLAKIPVDPEQIPQISQEVSNYQRILKEFQDVKTLSGINSLDEIEKIKSAAASFITVYNDFATMNEEFTNLLKPDFNDSENWLGARRKIIDVIDHYESELHDWMNYQSVRKECVESGLEDLCKAYEDGALDDQLESMHFKAVYKALIWDYIEDAKPLNSFSGLVFNDKINQYKNAEDELLALTREEMYCRLTQNLPSPYESGEIARELTLLKKAISNNGRGLSIRTLFEQIPHILTRLCPCLLMSPMSVAQYLPVSSDLFDIVVFDEASQVPTSQAVGALARGKDGIIVGDPNQMPPTSFFSSTFLDEENLEMEDLDSILDDCLALGMPETHLKWHYRSRHESLIAFSNKEYYDERMLTFPSVNDRERHVKLCTINGTYCRKRGNKNYKEGEAVVNEILRRYHNEELKKQTIGVVTFNMKQRELIEDLLDEEYKKNPEFDVWAHSSPDEPLFVKNLENVQGDERDVILFSVGFGPDENGKILYNFGPLNKDGGWKRLNVAVSRARRDMIVFSSMTPDMINTNKTSAKGVLGLKDFLFYAQNGILANRLYDDDLKMHGITQKLCAAIEEAGYKTQRNIGTSNMKIDIAVINPFDEDEYLLGIILDGDSYRMASTTKDRELSQISVLQDLGWRLHRVWTMDWWDNSKKEISTVMNILEREKQLAEERSLNPSFKDKGPESEEITYITQTDISERKTRKKKEEGVVVTDFDTFERFSPRTPKTDIEIGGKE